MERHREFTLRRIHSLLGVIPVGLFLTQHLVVNHFATKGEEAFNQASHFMESIPFILILEIFVIYLPLLYHAIYGIYIALTGKNNTKQYGTFRNWMFILQRVTGMITFIFVIWHVWETRVQAALGSTVEAQMMIDILSNPLMLVFYIVGVVSAVFHFANGLWSFAVTWGLTVSPKSQKIFTYVSLFIFLALSTVGVRALLAFVSMGS